MIAFESPEGTDLRALSPSRSATMAICLAALSERQNAWVSWASDELATTAQSIEVTALRFIQAASDGNERAARQLWAVLASFPTEGTESRIVQAARNLRGQMQF